MVATLDDGGRERGVEQLSRCQTTLSLSHLSLFTSNRLRADGAGKEQRSVGEEGRSKRLRVVGSGSKLPVPPAFACTHEVAFPSVLAKGILLQLIKASLLSTTPGSVPAAPGSPHTAVPSRIGLGLPLSLGKTSTTLAPCLCSAFIFVSASASSRQLCFRPREVPPWPPSWSLISASPSPASASRLGHLPSRPSPVSASRLGHLPSRPSPTSAISSLGHLPRRHLAPAISRLGYLPLRSSRFGLGHLASAIPPRPSRFGLSFSFARGRLGGDDLQAGHPTVFFPGGKRKGGGPYLFLFLPVKRSRLLLGSWKDSNPNL